MAGMRPYIVRQGDYLTKIAFQNDENEETIWEQPRNQELSKNGRTRDILNPGDVLYLINHSPTSHPLSCGRENPLEAQVPQIKITLLLMSTSREFCGCEFEVRDEFWTIEGRTDANGRAEFDVPTTAHEVDLVFPKLHHVFRLQIGGLDPLNESAGILQRLQQLGYLYTGPLSQQEEDNIRYWLHLSLKEFQLEAGIEETGEIDDATITHLKERFGA